MHKLDEVLQHAGVKGMRWGVRRDRNRPGGADGKEESTKVVDKRTNLKKNLDSLKREREWKKVVKEMDKLSTKDINSVSKRIGLENDLKKYSKSKVATRKDKDDYLRRENMSDAELSRKVARLRAKDGLNQKVRDASKEQRELGQKIVQVGGSLGFKYALTKTITPKDIFDAAITPKDSYNRSRDDLIKKAVPDDKERDALKKALEKIETKKN